MYMVDGATCFIGSRPSTKSAPFAQARSKTNTKENGKVCIHTMPVSTKKQNQLKTSQVWPHAYVSVQFGLVWFGSVEEPCNSPS